jgi:SAM-dependent methyltransferase
VQSADRLPEDPEERRKWLERWATEQEARIARPDASPVPRSRRDVAMLPLHWAERVLDRRLATAGRVSLPEHQHRDFVPYVPSPWYVLPRALRVTGVSRQGTFVDFGCGKGRIVHQAARRPFRRVIGVEISPVLADHARGALAARSSTHRCGEVEIVVAEAAEFPVPDDLSVAYFFDPFGGATFGAVIQRIIDSIDRNPRRVNLIYVHPRQGARILATGRFALVTELRGGLHDRRINRAAIFENA